MAGDGKKVRFNLGVHFNENVMEAYENVRRYISEEEYRTVLKLANSPNRGTGINQPFYCMVILGFIILYFKEICYMV